MRAKIVRYLLLHWRPEAIARETGVHIATVYRIESNLAMYGSPTKPLYHQVGRPPRLTQEDKNALFKMLLSEGWRQQNKIVHWLATEQGVLVNQLTVSRLIKKQQ